MVGFAELGGCTADTPLPAGKCCDKTTKKIATGPQQMSWRWCEAQDSSVEAAVTGASAEEMKKIPFGAEVMVGSAELGGCTADTPLPAGKCCDKTTKKIANGPQQMSWRWCEAQDSSVEAALIGVSAEEVKKLHF